jgi:hypothetical protein
MQPRLTWESEDDIAMVYDMLVEGKSLVVLKE